MVEFNIVEQLRSVVEGSGMVEQVAGAGRVEQQAWAAVHMVVLVLVVAGMMVSLEKVRSRYEGEEDSHAAMTWRTIVWCLGVVLVVLFAFCFVCDVVTYFQYCRFPKAMVLRDILRKVRF